VRAPDHLVDPPTRHPSANCRLTTAPERQPRRQAVGALEDRPWRSATPVFPAPGGSLPTSRGHRRLSTRLPHSQSHGDDVPSGAAIVGRPPSHSRAADRRPPANRSP
jgi:hypothetical protein